MKRILLAGATLLALATAQPTLAADAPVYKGPAPRVEALFSWQGFYVGIHAGYGWGAGDWAVTVDGFGFLVPPGLPVNIKGGLYGAQIGYNWQSGSLVYGLELDFSGANIEGFSFTVPDDDGYRTRVSWFGTIRGRIGVASGPMLWYLTGGAAYGRISGTTGDILADLSFNPGFSTSDSGVKWGWTVGAGLEWAFTGNWSLRGEYLYVDLGTFQFSGLTPGGGLPVLANINTHFHVARAAVNFRW